MVFINGFRSLKVTAIDSELRLVKTAKVNYDADLKHYGTKDGVHRDPHGEQTFHFQHQYRSGQWRLCCSLLRTLLIWIRSVELKIRTIFLSIIYE